MFEEVMLNEIAERCDHIHARVGNEEAPQVPDIRDDKYQSSAKQVHFAFWEQIWRSRLEEAKELQMMNQWVNQGKDFFTKTRRDNKTKNDKENEELTIRMTSEYGPVPYTPTIPFTNEPLTDILEVTEAAKDEIKIKFELL